MGAEAADPRWEGMLEEIFGGLTEWRATHPKATFAEIEQVVEERLSDARARFVEDLALQATSESGDGAPRPGCPQCGKPLVSRGQMERQVTVAGNRSVRLKRSYATCPACGAGLFPPG